MPYQGYDVKDRIAVGDNKFNMYSTPDGRTELSPAPDEVTEPGTDINKALLQPLIDTVVNLDTQRLPYTDYWWRRRATGRTWYETQTPGRSSIYHSSAMSDGYSYYYLCFFRSHYYTNDSGERVSEDTDSVTVTYASGININQTNGAVTLKSPRTLTINYGDYTDDQLQAMFAGKYVMGLHGCYSNTIYYIPTTSYVRSQSWGLNGSDESWNEHGYERETDGKQGHGYNTKFMEVGSAYSDTIGKYEYISSPDIDKYPHSGTENGFTYEYLGIIKDVSLANATPPGIETFTIDSRGVAVIPYDRFMFITAWIWGVATKSTLQMMGMSYDNGSSSWVSGYFSFVKLQSGQTLYNADNSEESSNGLSTIGVTITQEGLQFTSGGGTVTVMKL